MRIAIAGWHYRHRSMAENIRYFAAAGYDVFSALGKDFAEAFQNPGEPDEIAAAIRESGCAFTVHYGIADPADREATAVFYRSILDILAWQRKYGLLEILSFDVWYPEVYAAVEYIVSTFAKETTKIAFEDFCLAALPEKYAQLWKKYPFYELLDAGHMNIHLYSADKDNSPKAFLREMQGIPLPVIETHIHNNRGLKDMHCPLLDPTLLAEEEGTFPTRRYIRNLHALGWDDVIITVEIMPFLYGARGKHGDAVAIQDLRFVRRILELECQT